MQRLGPESAAVEVGELAMVLEQFVGPDALHDLERLAHMGVLSEVCDALAAANSSGIQPEPTPTSRRPFDR